MWYPVSALANISLIFCTYREMVVFEMSKEEPFLSHLNRYFLVIATVYWVFLVALRIFSSFISLSAISYRYSIA